MSRRPPASGHRTAAAAIGTPPLLSALSSGRSSPAVATAQPQQTDSPRGDGRASSATESASSATAERFHAPPNLNIYNVEELYRAYLAKDELVGQLRKEIARLNACLLDAQLQQQRRGRGRGRQPPTLSSTNTSTASNVDPQAPGDASSETVADIEKAVSKDGAYHGCFWNLFVSPSIFAMPQPPFGPEDLERYESEANIALGATSEIYATVDKKFHSLMRLTTQNVGKNYFKLFKGALDSNRSNSIRIVCRDRPAAVYDLPSDLFTSDGLESPRNSDPRIRKLLGYIASSAPDGTPSYERFPPILYRDSDNTTDISDRFLGPCLFRIARIVMFGKSAATNVEAAVGRSVSAFIRPGTTPTTTVGFIAWISTLARYGLSPDPAFRSNGIGSVTLIPYLTDFEYYKRWLVEAKHNPLSADWFSGLISKWNLEVFSRHIRATGGDNPDAEVVELDENTPLNDGDAITRELDLFAALSLGNPPVPHRDHSSPAPLRHATDAPAPNHNDDDDDDEENSDFYVDELSNPPPQSAPPPPPTSQVLASHPTASNMAPAQTNVASPTVNTTVPTPINPPVPDAPINPPVPAPTNLRRSSRSIPPPASTSQPDPPSMEASGVRGGKRGGRGGRSGRGKKT
ncbi:hypothetical protein NLJ89_g7125 [Agrocybe chaxingu]|uniref:Uncharacterized protein n=1 Tax=Agrocybe chaxingu TaxID=84603 RepID=A0A9W8JXE6_9AGAR|nr:hypothetical protein NLJ89_g7125 [Agrocybe chaxingu]